MLVMQLGLMRLQTKLQKKGTMFKTVASSIHSPTSFASIISGKYPHNHGVHTFSHALSDETHTIFDIESYYSRFLNSIFINSGQDNGNNEDHIYPVLNQPVPSENCPVRNLGTPFISMERGPGGHSPYGDFIGTAPEYYKSSTSKSWKEVRADYKKSVEKDSELFQERIDTLESMGLIDNTLIIYTSDHGELLGEGGLVGHNSPIRPELVYIPTVFIHPDIPNSVIEGSAIRHVDLAPTILSAIDKNNLLDSTDGDSLTETKNNNIAHQYGLCTYRNSFELSKLKLDAYYKSIWDYDGGHVYPQIPLHKRLSSLGAQLLHSSKSNLFRKNIGEAVNSYVYGRKTYKSPTFTLGEGETIIGTYSDGDNPSSEAPKLSDSAKNQLEDLGYL